MRIHQLAIGLALFAGLPTAVSAGTFVLDDFATPSPLTAIDSPTGTVVANLQGPYGRALVANAFVEGAVSYRAGNGEFVRRPTDGASGETILAYLGYGYGGFVSTDLSGYHWLRLDFNDVFGPTPLNLNVEFYTSEVTADKPLYYGDVGINWLYTPLQRSAYLPLDGIAEKFRFDSVQGIGIFFDRSGFGVDGFALDQIVLTTDGPSVPEPASWALMIAGFGVVGAAARQRRAVALA